MEPLREPPGVRPVRLGVYEGLRGVYRPAAEAEAPPSTPMLLLSLSLSESGVEADSEERDGRDMATERCERSRTCMQIWDECQNMVIGGHLQMWCMLVVWLCGALKGPPTYTV